MANEKMSHPVAEGEETPVSMARKRRQMPLGKTHRPQTALPGSRKKSLAGGLRASQGSLRASESNRFAMGFHPLSAACALFVHFPVL
jgi:hypothetical protein